VSVVDSFHHIYIGHCLISDMHTTAMWEFALAIMSDGFEPRTLGIFKPLLV